MKEKIVFIFFVLLSSASAFASCNIVSSNRTGGFAVSSGSYAISIDDRLVEMGSPAGRIIESVMSHAAKTPMYKIWQSSFSYAVCSPENQNICYSFQTQWAAKAALDAINNRSNCITDY